MITLENALKIAKELKPTVNTCTEYDDAFVFGCKEDDNFEGGNHSPCVVMKDTEKAVTLPYYLINGSGNEIKTFDI